MGILQSLFGGSSQQSSNWNQSYNRAYDGLEQWLAPLLPNAYKGADTVGALLGVRPDLGSEAQRIAFDNYRGSTGYDFQKDQGIKAIQQGMAGGGTFNSGATAKALQKYGTGLADQSFQGYLQNLMGLSDQGLKVGQVLTGAGDRSEGTGASDGSSSTGGLGKTIGKSLSSLSFLSDRRLKKNINKVAEHEGLNVYEYSYIWNDVLQKGVMAQEVAELYPEALGPTVGGYMTVDYSKIPNWVL